MVIVKLPYVLSFEWDKGNEQKNWIRHRVTAEEAEEPFFTDDYLILEDEAHSSEQEEPITEAIDTTTSGGKLIFHIFGALAEFERDIIKERTQAGLTAARARGRKGGRPKALTPKKAQQALTLYNERKSTIDEICSTLNISRATLYRSRLKQLRSTRASA